MVLTCDDHGPVGVAAADTQMLETLPSTRHAARRCEAGANSVVGGRGPFELSSNVNSSVLVQVRAEAVQRPAEPVLGVRPS
jgi:hypothetical protein